MSKFVWIAQGQAAGGGFWPELSTDPNVYARDHSLREG
jgi:hypothetical protein